MGRLMSIVEVARSLGVTEQTVRNWISNGYIDFKNVGRSRYIDSGVIESLRPTIEEIMRYQRRYESLRDELYCMHEELYEEKTRIRFQNVVYNNAFRSRFFAVVLRLLVLNGSIDEREGRILNDYLNGNTLEYIAKSEGLTRERIRQIVERAIRRSSQIEGIEDKFKTIERLEEENRMLKIANQEMRKKLAGFEKPLDDEEAIVNRELCRLFQKKLVDCGLSVRALHSLRNGNTVKRYTKGKVEEYVAVPPCETVGDFCKLKKQDVLKMRSIGKKTMGELEDFLCKNNLSWEMDVNGIFEKYSSQL